MIGDDPLFYGHFIFWIWGAWALIWLISAFGTKKTARREPFGPRLVYILIGVVGAVLIASDRLPWSPPMNLRLWPRSAPGYWIGLAVLLAGVAFAVWARVHLGRNWSGTVTVKQDHELIRSGPYGYVRHPIYTGLITGLIGTAICSGTLRAAIGVAIISAALYVKSRTEELFMRETFPGQYERYRAAVPALVPFSRRRRSAA